MSAANRIELTDARVKAYTAKRPAATSGEKVKPLIVRDTKTRGFFLEVNTSSASYRVITTTHERKQLKVTLGRISEMDVHEARRRAEDILARARHGEAKAVITAPKPKELTLGEAYARYLEGRDRQRMDPVHTSNIRLNAKTHLSDWMDLPMSAVTYDMVVERHAKIGNASGPYAANHTIKQLRAVLNSHPVTRKANPVEGIVWFKPNEELDEHGQPVSKVIPLDQLPAWWKAAGELDNPLRVAMHQLALLSGMRYGHLTKTRRAWVDRAGKCIRYPKLKRGKPFTLPLSPPMLAAVEAAMKLELKDNPYLFWAESTSGHIEDWREKETGWREWPEGTPDDEKEPLPTGHCLRHTYVSIAHSTPLTDHHRRVLVDHSAGKDIHGKVYTDLSHSFRELLEAQTVISGRILDAAGVKKEN
jgi:integrase